VIALQHGCDAPVYKTPEAAELDSEIEMKCSQCPTECAPVDGMCPSCFIAASEARDAGKANDVQRTMHRAALKGKQYGNGGMR
jgi:hypothetical protein